MKTKDFFKRLNENSSHMSRNFPSTLATRDFINQLSDFLFPVCRKSIFDPSKTEISWNMLKLHLHEILVPIEPLLKSDLNQVVEKYFNKIPEIYDRLRNDAYAILEFDPAAHSIEEVIMSYPGFDAIMFHRLAHELHNLNVPIVPRIISEYSHSKTGIDINPGANIGDNFFIDHGTGIVIGETAVIGNNVKIYQGVTIGAVSVKKEEAKRKRHPTIEDNVTIYSGATILGGKTIIGHDSVIGGNVWLTKSVEPYTLVYQTGEFISKPNKEFPEPINFVI